MRQLVRQPPMPPMPGWGPLTHPQPRQGRLAATALRELAIFAALIVAALRSGWFAGGTLILAVLVTRGLIGILFWCRSKGGWREVGRALVAGVAIAALAVLAVGAPTVPAKAKPKPPVVRVDAAQADRLEDARTTWSEAWARAASLFSESYDKAKKEGTR